MNDVFVSWNHPKLMHNKIYNLIGTMFPDVVIDMKLSYMVDMEIRVDTDVVFELQQKLHELSPEAARTFVAIPLKYRPAFFEGNTNAADPIKVVDYVMTTDRIMAGLTPLAYLAKQIQRVVDSAQKNRGQSEQEAIAMLPSWQRHFYINNKQILKLNLV
ncbi:MAG: hypothetical protein ACRCWQ_02800 [Bacilli bacterium]